MVEDEDFIKKEKVDQLVCEASGTAGGDSSQDPPDSTSSPRPIDTGSDEKLIKKLEKTRKEVTELRKENNALQEENTDLLKSGNKLKIENINLSKSLQNLKHNSRKKEYEDLMLAYDLLKKEKEAEKNRWVALSETHETLRTSYEEKEKRVKQLESFVQGYQHTASLILNTTSE